ncbi:MAG: hypothetical protein ABSH56_16225 [Bryobacteraceae bacterium]
MRTRFDVDRPTALPHIYNHQVDEGEVMEVLESRAKNGREEADRGLLWARPHRAGNSARGSSPRALRGSVDL